VSEYAELNCFVLIVGNARSGSTLLGAVIDAHPHALVANESSASVNFWRDTNRQEILDEIRRNSEGNRASGRPSAGYGYLIAKKMAGDFGIRVMGDKIWNPATLLLHGDHGLLGWLTDTLGVPIKIVHAIRNPFDVVATMHAKSRAPIRDRIAWYFMHCDAVQAIREHNRSAGYLDVHHEGLIASPDRTIANLCDFLELDHDREHVQACKGLLFDQPRQTRFDVQWDAADIERVVAGMARHDFLARYAGDDYSDLAGKSG